MASILPSVSAGCPRYRPTSAEAAGKVRAVVLEAQIGEVPPAGNVGAPIVGGPAASLGPGVSQDVDIGHQRAVQFLATRVIAFRRQTCFTWHG